MGLFCRPLPKDQDASQHKCEENCRRRIATECQPTSAERLVKKITYHSAKGTREYKRTPKKQGARYGCPVIRRNHECQQNAEYHRTSQIAKTSRVSRPIAQRSA